MSRKAGIVVSVAVVAVLLGTALFAGNFGFKMNYRLRGPGEVGGGQAASVNGWNTLALPFIQQLDQPNEFNIIQDINSFPPAGNQVVQWGRWDKTSDSFQLYNGVTGVGLPLVPGAGYAVQVNAGVDYVFVGTHNNDLQVSLDGPGPLGRGLDESANGINVYAHPLGARSTDAFDLITEINIAGAAGFPPNAVIQVGRWNANTDSWALYNGLSGTPGGFCLFDGEAFFVQVERDVPFVPVMGPLDSCPPLE